MQINKHLILILIGIATLTTAMGQRMRVLDSLFITLDNTKDESIKVVILKDLSWEFRSSDPGKAFDYGVEALSIAQKNRMYSELASIYNYLGVIRRNQGNYTSALEYFFSALQRAEEHKNNLEIAYAFNNISGIYNLQGKYGPAQDYVNKAIKKFEELNDLRGLAYTYTQFSYICKETGEYKKALAYLEKAFAIQKLRKVNTQIAVIFNTKGEIYKKTGQKDSALFYYFESLKLREKNGDKNAMVQSYNSIGYFYNDETKYSQALNYLNIALEMGKEIKSPRRIRAALQGLAKAHAGLGNFKQAYNYHIDFKQVSDSLINEESVKRVTQLEMQYLYDKKLKDQEFEARHKDLQQKQELRQMAIKQNIIILAASIVFVLLIVLFFIYRTNRKSNKKLGEQKRQMEKQRDKLEVVNATKDKFFSIIAHDLKNPFTSIIGFSELLLKQYQRFSIEQIMEFLQSINTTSKQTHKLLENLLEWARTQTGNIEYSPEIVDFSIIAKENVILQKGSAKKKKVYISIDVEENLMVYIDKNMIDTALRNITTNAIKFTHPEGKVVISALDFGQYVKVTVSDNGIGMTQEEIKKLFKIDKFHTTKGTNQESGTGLGLIICKEFIEKNGGSIEVESSSGVGTKFSFTLPKPDYKQLEL